MKTRLNGRTWLQYSISVWNDIRKSPEEQKSGHPASYPRALVHRLLDCFFPEDKGIVLDPFLGSGTTLLAAGERRLCGVGFEQMACERIPGAIFVSEPGPLNFKQDEVLLFVVCDDARKTSPPYWSIHTRPRSVDRKKARPYSNLQEDLGNIRDYGTFLLELKKVFTSCWTVLKPGSCAIVNVMDLRCGSDFIPFHMDLTGKLKEAGFKLEDKKP